MSKEVLKERRIEIVVVDHSGSGGGGNSAAAVTEGDVCVITTEFHVLY